MAVVAVVVAIAVDEFEVAAKLAVATVVVASDEDDEELGCLECFDRANVGMRGFSTSSQRHIRYCFICSFSRREALNLQIDVNMSNSVYVQCSLKVYMPDISCRRNMSKAPHEYRNHFVMTLKIPLKARISRPSRVSTCKAANWRESV